MNDNEEFYLGTNEDVSISSSKNDKCDIDEFYSLLVEDWREAHNSDYEQFLQQGIIPAKTIYKVLGLKTFETVTDENIPYLEELKAKLLNDAEKFQRTDIEKRNDTVDAIGCLFLNFLNKKKNVVFTEGLKLSTLSHLNTVINDKCSDGKVTLCDMAGIYKVASDLGLFEECVKNQTKQSIKNAIEKSGATTENITEAFTSYFESYKKQNSNNELKTQANIDNLFEKYKEYSDYESFITGKEKNVSKEDFEEFLTTCNITLVDPVLLFKKDYFDNFFKNHDVSRLSVDDYIDLMGKAASYGIVDEQWSNFERDNFICRDTEDNKIEVNEEEYSYSYEEDEDDDEDSDDVENKKSKVPAVLLSLAVIFVFIMIFKNTYGISSSVLPGSDEIKTPVATTKPMSDEERYSNVTKAALECRDKNLSRTALQDYLRHEFSEEEANYAIKNLDIDWTKAAFEAGKEYLKDDTSKNKIYTNLVNDKKFTDEEASVAISRMDVNWNKVALNKASSYIKNNTYSKNALYAKLTAKEQFSQSEANYALNNLDVDWMQMAMKNAEQYIKKQYTKEQIYDTLLNEDRFSEEEATYVSEKVGRIYDAKDLAEHLANKSHKSKEYTYKQLLKMAKKNFSEEEAKSAIDILDTDWKNNAYLTLQKMTKHGIKHEKQWYYDALIRNQFTEEEANYALNKISWK